MAEIKKFLKISMVFLLVVSFIFYVNDSRKSEKEVREITATRKINLVTWQGGFEVFSFVITPGGLALAIGGFVLLFALYQKFWPKKA